MPVTTWWRAITTSGRCDRRAGAWYQLLPRGLTLSYADLLARPARHRRAGAVALTRGAAGSPGRTKTTRVVEHTILSRFSAVLFYISALYYLCILCRILVLRSGISLALHSLTRERRIR